MSDWIDNLRKQDAEQRESVARSDAIRIHNAKMVYAKAPALWGLLIAKIDADLKRLKETFPNDFSRQGDLIQRGDSYTLQGKKLPICVMELTLNLDGSCINISQALKQEFADTPTLTPSKPIDFTVTNDEDVVFFWKDWKYADPSALAEQLIKLVCRLY